MDNKNKSVLNEIKEKIKGGYPLENVIIDILINDIDKYIYSCMSGFGLQPGHTPNYERVSKCYTIKDFEIEYNFEEDDLKLTLKDRYKYSNIVLDFKYISLIVLHNSNNKHIALTRDNVNEILSLTKFDLTDAIEMLFQTNIDGGYRINIKKVIKENK